MNNKNTQTNIKLRSEKFHRFIGEIPTSLIRWGFIMILVFSISLIAIIVLTPYPYGNGETIFQHYFLYP